MSVKKKFLLILIIALISIGMYVIYTITLTDKVVNNEQAESLDEVITTDPVSEIDDMDEEEASIFLCLEQELIQQIDITDNVSSEINSMIESDVEYQEDFLANYKEYLEIDSITYGYFTGSQVEEALVVFSVLNCNHTYGYDRKLVMIYNIETGDANFQHCFAGDSVQIAIVENNTDDYCCIFAISGWTHSGSGYGSAEFGSLESGEWSAIESPSSTMAGSYYYVYNNEILSITEIIAGTEETDYYQTYGETTFYEFSWTEKTFVEQ